MKKICIVVSTLFTANAFLRDQIRALARTYRVSVAANPGDGIVFDEPGVELVRVPIERPVAPFRDLAALVQLYRAFRRERFDAVHSFTPKAGLLAMLAAFAARVPLRVHTFTGQVWATRSGLRRTALKAFDRVIAGAATHVLVDSRSQHEFLRSEGVLAAGRGAVLARGSISGVDPARFRPDAAVRAAVRAEHDVPQDAALFVFVGRLTRDKGVLDLARAFAAVAADAPRAYLLVVGPDEEAMAPRLREAAGEGVTRLRIVGRTDTPERYMSAADVFCLPSYREGFGSTVIEAAAAGAPAIGSRVYGITDAIEDGVTGLLVRAGDPAALAAAMLRLARDEALRRRLAENARRRALSDFSQQNVTSALLAFYERALGGETGAASAKSAP